MYKVKTLSILSAIMLLLSCSQNNYIFTGTYTKQDKSGIHVFTLNEKNGSLSPISKTENINNPSYLALSKNKQYLYAVNETSQSGGGVSAFSFNKTTGKLNLINQEFSAESLAPCYIALDQTNQYITVANYVSGNFCVYPIQSDGSVAASQQCIQFAEEKGRKPHAHQTVFSSDNKHLFVTDLGTDKLYQYQFNLHAPTPVVNNPKVYQLPEGYGPRHLVMNAAGKYLYLLNEWEGNIFAYQMQNDTLRFMQEIVSTNIVDPQNKNKGSAAIKISPDGKFLYASNRGITNTIAIFRIEKNGELTRAGEQKTDEHPRDFMLSKSGKYLLVASRDNNNIKTYRRNAHTGLLTYTGMQTNISAPVMLLEY